MAALNIIVFLAFDTCFTYFMSHMLYHSMRAYATCSIHYPLGFTPKRGEVCNVTQQFVTVTGVAVQVRMDAMQCRERTRVKSKRR